jgi:hypothetical protein
MFIFLQFKMLCKIIYAYYLENVNLVMTFFILQLKFF